MYTSTLPVLMLLTGAGSWAPGAGGAAFFITMEVLRQGASCWRPSYTL